MPEELSRQVLRFVSWKDEALKTRCHDSVDFFVAKLRYADFPDGLYTLAVEEPEPRQSVAASKTLIEAFFYPSRISPDEILDFLRERGIECGPAEEPDDDMHRMSMLMGLHGMNLMASFGTPSDEGPIVWTRFRFNGWKDEKLRERFKGDAQRYVEALLAGEDPDFPEDAYQVRSVHEAVNGVTQIGATLRIEQNLNFLSVEELERQLRRVGLDVEVME